MGVLLAMTLWLHVPLAMVLFAGAVVGHGAILVFSLNRWYAYPFPRPLLRKLKALHAVLALTSPFVVLLVYGWDLTATWSLDAAGWWFIANGYVFICWVVALGVIPVATIVRCSRPKPVSLLSNDTTTIDMAKRLGYAPMGQRHLRHFTRLPGNEVYRVDFVERTFRIPYLPEAWDGLSIVHLTDLHMKGSPDRAFFREVMDLCNEKATDLVAVTGDIVDSDYHHKWIVPVLGRLKWKYGAFSVLGNHDSWHQPELIRRRLRRIGIKPMNNCWEQVEVRGSPMIVIGNECPWYRPEPDMSECPEDIFRFCLTHTPDNIGWCRENSVDLMVAGHVHGGQVRIPWIGSIFVPSKFGRRYDCGSFHEPPTLMHVSRGVSGQEPIRYFCRPEVTRIVLRRSIT